MGPSAKSCAQRQFLFSVRWEQKGVVQNQTPMIRQTSFFPSFFHSLLTRWTVDAMFLVPGTVGGPRLWWLLERNTDGSLGAWEWEGQPAEGWESAGYCPESSGCSGRGRGRIPSVTSRWWAEAGRGAGQVRGGRGSSPQRVCILLKPWILP